EKLQKYVADKFDMRPRGIIDQLDLLRPIYAATASYGHFGRPEFSWEKTDRAAELAEDLLGARPRRQNGAAQNGASRGPAPKAGGKKRRSGRTGAEARD